MDTHAALTSPFHAAWFTTDPGTPIYDDLTRERGITPAGLPSPRPRGMFEPAVPVPVEASTRQAHPNPYPPAAGADEHRGEVDEPTQVYPRHPARPLAAR
ncbi:hypothetical protein [Streptosporangium sp. NPDC051022]|uniref:hypothetical protein n=1 Tax=Streptosporangium sp. NPDC051022 TaxID=3155752 RepID=UPI00343D9BDC